MRPLEDVFKEAENICKSPIPKNAAEQLDKLRLEVPEEKLDEFDWFYESAVWIEGLEDARRG